MQSRLHYVAAAFLAVLVLGPAVSRGADPDVRAAIMGRQKIRAELAVAMQDNNLGPREQYRLLLKAKDMLSPQDFEAFQRTLDRLATTNPGPAAAVVERPTERIAGHFRDLLGEEESPHGTEVSYESAEEALPETIPAGTPFEEEGPGDVVQPYAGGCDEDGDCGGALCDGVLLDRLGTIGHRGLSSINIFSTVDAFKGPLDLENLNGNFGVRFGINGAIPLSRRAGIGLQGGTSATIADFHGTPFTDAGTRTQQFLTVGIFQRIPVRAGSVGWGFTYDWMFDEYYSMLHFGQWRVKLAYELNPSNEIGVWAALHDRGDSALIGNEVIGFLTERFKPLTQGNIYWRHTWMNDANVAARFGVAEEPGQFIFGADSWYPISQRLALISDVNYILPSSRGGFEGQSEEMWNVSVGIEFVPGRGHGCSRHRFAPLLPLADNGSFAVRRLP